MNSEVNVYQRVIVIAKRAKDIHNGSAILTEAEEGPILTAAKEFDKGIISFKPKDKKSVVDRLFNLDKN